MALIIAWLEKAFRIFPLPLLEMWGRVSFIIGIVLAVAAFGGFTFRPGGRWSLGRERQSWDIKAFTGLTVSFALIILAGYVGSFVVLVPGAQTLEILKDIVVFLSILYFGYPALLVTPLAYGISDVIEGVPLGSIGAWFLGYFINPAFFWIGYQLIGKNPDFRIRKTWNGYLLFVLFFMIFEPLLWGYLCAGKFTSEISYRNITPALFFTTAITWIFTPLAVLLTFPLVKKLKLFWADIPEHVSEKEWCSGKWVWTSGSGQSPHGKNGIPIHWMIGLTFGALLCVVVSISAYCILRGAEKTAHKLILQQQASRSQVLVNQLDQPVVGSTSPGELLAGVMASLHGKYFVFDAQGKLIAESGKNGTEEIVKQQLREHLLKMGALPKVTPFEFQVVGLNPLSSEKWTAIATPYQRYGNINWTLVAIASESSYLESIRLGSSQSATALAIFLTLSLVIAGYLAIHLTKPLKSLVRATRAMTLGNGVHCFQESHIEEVDELSKSFHEMSLQLSGAISELRISKERAETTAQERQEFLDIAAHELRTPVTALSLLTSLAQKKLSLGVPVTDEKLAQLQSRIKALGELVEDFLNVSRLERGGFEIRSGEHDLVAAVKECVEEAHLRSPNRKLTVDAPPGKILMNFDQSRISQVMANLLENCFKYTPEGTPIEVQVLSDALSTHVAITDHGAGIPKNLQSKLFSKFYRASTNQKQTGLGLGLYVCKKIIEGHRGKIYFKSEEGGGSRFEFELPIARC